MTTPSRTGTALIAMSPSPAIESSSGNPPAGPPPGSAPFPGTASEGMALPYTPSIAMAIIGALAFTALGFLLMFQVRKNKGSFFFMPLQGVFFLVASLWARLATAVNPKNTTASAVISITNLIGPAFLFIGVSMTFTRIMWWITPNEHRNLKTLWFPPKSATMLFGGLALMLDQVKGFVSAPHSKVPLVLGLFEIFICVTFAVMTFRYYRISRKWRFEEDVGQMWWKLILVCIVATLPYIVRLIYKTVLQSAQDQDPHSFIVTHESFFWFFDMIPLFVMYALFAYMQPGDIIPRVWTRSSFDSELILELLRLRKLASNAADNVELEAVTIKPHKV